MSQAESPQTQVGGSVRDAAQAELNGVDSLMQQVLWQIKLKEIKANVYRMLWQAVTNIQISE